MRTAILVLLVSLALVPSVLPEDKKPSETQPVELTDEARRIHADALLIDGHNDLPWQYRTKADLSFLNLDISRPQKDLHTDIPRCARATSAPSSGPLTSRSRRARRARPSAKRWNRST